MDTFPTMESHDDGSPEFDGLLAALADGTDQPADVAGWLVKTVGGGANNRLYRATKGRFDFAIKFAKRDDRDRAGREYNALLVLHGLAADLALRPIFLDRDRYASPVVVQGWVDGSMARRPPRSREEWDGWLNYLAAIHQIEPEHTDVELLHCCENYNGSKGYQKSLSAMQLAAETEKLPSEVGRLIRRIEPYCLAEWPPVRERLCRADHNVRNFIWAHGHLRSVDWEYSGWGDSTEDLAEMMAHVSYMDVPHRDWGLVVGQYMQYRDAEALADRLQVCLAIKVVSWVVRLARLSASQGTHGSGSEWRGGYREKYDYYIDRIANDDQLTLLRP